MNPREKKILNKRERSAKHVEQRLKPDRLFEVKIMTQRSSGKRFSKFLCLLFTLAHPLSSLALLMGTTTINMTS